MEKGLSQQSREFMAATGRCAVRAKCRKHGWRKRKARPESWQAADFRHHDLCRRQPQLANVKAVDDIYPMYGDLQLIPLA